MSTFNHFHNFLGLESLCYYWKICVALIIQSLIQTTLLTNNFDLIFLFPRVDICGGEYGERERGHKPRALGSSRLEVNPLTIGVAHAGESHASHKHPDGPNQYPTDQIAHAHGPWIEAILLVVSSSIFLHSFYLEQLFRKAEHIFIMLEQLFQKAPPLFSIILEQLL